MADNYLEWRMDDLRKHKVETEAQIRRRVRMRRELERIAAERRAAKAAGNASEGICHLPSNVKSDKDE